MACPHEDAGDLIRKTSSRIIRRISCLNSFATMAGVEFRPPSRPALLAARLVPLGLVHSSCRWHSRNRITTHQRALLVAPQGPLQLPLRLAREVHLPTTSLPDCATTVRLEYRLRPLMALLICRPNKKIPARFMGSGVKQHGASRRIAKKLSSRACSVFLASVFGGFYGQC